MSNSIAYICLLTDKLNWVIKCVLCGQTSLIRVIRSQVELSSTFWIIIRQTGKILELEVVLF